MNELGKYSQRKMSIWQRLVSVWLIMCVGLAPVSGHAVEPVVAQLPAPGTMVALSNAHVPVLARGMTVHPEQPLRFDFIFDSGNVSSSAEDIKDDADRIVRYFMAALTVPRQDLWVNLSPGDSDRIIPAELARTQLGRDLLAQDYLLKQLSSSLLHPDDAIGHDFWQRVYRRVQQRFGTTDIPLDTFNKVWIIPERARVYENGPTVYVVDAHLKVMLEQDYLSAKGNSEQTAIEEPMTVEIIREIVIPEIEREVNSGANFAPLRQIYYALILAKWYKQTVHQGILRKAYVDQSKVTGVDDVDDNVATQIYDRYVSAYQRGVFNFIKEDYDQLSGRSIPRRYFSGGFEDAVIALQRTDGAMLSDAQIGQSYIVNIDLSPVAADTIPVAADQMMEALLNNPEATLAGAIFSAGAVWYAWYRFVYSKSRRYDLRQKVKAALGQLKREKGKEVQALRRAMKRLLDRDVEAVDDAIADLGRYPHQAAIEPLAWFLESRGPYQRAEAIRMLTTIRHSDTVPYLIRALKIGQDLLIQEVEAALGSFKLDDYTDDLVEVMLTGKLPARQAARRLLETVNPLLRTAAYKRAWTQEESPDIALELLAAGETDKKILNKVLGILTQRRSFKYLHDAEERAAATEQEVRAIRVLGEIRAESAVGVLHGMMDSNLSEAVFSALANIKSRQSVSPAILMLDRENSSLTNRARGLLRALDVELTEAYLIRLANTGNIPMIVRAALNAGAPSRDILRILTERIGTAEDARTVWAARQAMDEIDVPQDDESRIALLTDAVTAGMKNTDSVEVMAALIEVVPGTEKDHPDKDPYIQVVQVLSERLRTETSKPMLLAIAQALRRLGAANRGRKFCGIVCPLIMWGIANWWN